MVNAVDALRPSMPNTNSIEAITAIRFGYNSTNLPNIAAPKPRQKMIKVKPMSAANFEISKHC